MRPLAPWVALAAVALAGCDEVPAAVPEDQAVLEVEGRERVPLSRLALGGWQGCGSQLCLHWSAERGLGWLRLQLPPMEGRVSLSDPQVRLGYELSDGLSLPLLADFPCRSCEGEASVQVDLVRRALIVTVRGKLGERWDCTVHHCGTLLDADAFTWRIETCDGGVCLTGLPCEGDVLRLGEPGCPNPATYKQAIRVEARAALVE